MARAGGSAVSFLLVSVALGFVAHEQYDEDCQSLLQTWRRPKKAENGEKKVPVFLQEQDSPEDPMRFTNEQQQGGVMVEYAETQWTIKSAGSRTITGRSLLFKSRSDLLPAGLTTTTTTSSDISTCILRADQDESGFDNIGIGKGQLRTFDQKLVDLDDLEVRDFWLVKSEAVFIQGRFRISPDFNRSHAAIGAVAVGGPFIRNRTIVVEPLDGQVTVDGLVALDGSRIDASGTMFLRRASAEDVEVWLPMNVKLTFKRFSKHIDVSIAMPHISGGVDGECGNNDGIAENDDTGGVRGRMGSVFVEDSKLLFNTKLGEVTEDPREQDATKSAAAEQTTRASGNRAIVGGAAIGAVLAGGAGGCVGGVVGMVAGGVAGLPLALFSFGLSIPVAAFVGGGAGVIVGAAAGGTAGAVGGAAAAYRYEHHASRN